MSLLASHDDTLPSVYERVWDQHLSESEMTPILVGSSINVVAVLSITANGIRDAVSRGSGCVHTLNGEDTPNSEDTTSEVRPETS